MKNALAIFALSFALCAALGGLAADAAKQLWTCGMHPQVVLDHPGDCPICHMKLVPLKKDAAAGEGAVMVSPEARQTAGIVAVPVERGEATRSIRSVGTLAYDERSLADVTTKYRAWIEKLDVDFTGREVHKGETLLELYAPDVFNAEAEYLIARKSGDKKLIGSAKLKLDLLDVQPGEIAKLEKAGKPSRTIALPSPRDGVVVEKNAVQGSMVEPGTRLYRIADLGTLWALARIYERDLPFLELGQRVVVETPYFPGRRYHGAVAYIYPDVDEATRTAKVRVELHNPGYTLKPGMFVNLELEKSGGKDALLIPAGAVLRGGDMDMVFIDLGDGRYEPRAIELGPRVGNDRYQVLRGLKEDERVVASGQFLLDSEANMRAAFRRLSPPGARTPDEALRAEAPDAKAKPLEYVCPMPEHMSISYKEPGKCRICGMTLVPWDGRDPKPRPIDHYTCPMHPEALSKTPGDCPKCGMTLIPVYKSDAQPKPDHYECPMKEDAYSSPTPGSCPKCGMDLVPVFKSRTPHAEHAAKPEAKPDHYECPMKEYNSPKPGKCPKCGMALVPVYAK